MITFKNLNTNHIFVLPKKDALEIINQEPELYKVISGIEKDLLIKPAVVPVDLSKDIYNLVVVADSEVDEDMKTTKNIVKKTVKKSTVKRKTAKRKVTKFKKKEK